MIAVKVKDIIKRFGELTAVDGISFEVPQGCCFGILGPNGAGKTTTLELLEGINLPDSGAIDYPMRPQDQPLQQHIGIQFQQTAIQDYMKVGETIELFAALYGLDEIDSKLIEICQLGSLQQRFVKDLSGGQRQRLLLALALLHQPEVVFLDEPTTGLDPQSRRNFWQLIHQIKAQGKTIVLTTHYMEEAELLCDQIAIIDAGKIIAMGCPKALLAKHFSGVLIKLPASNLAAVADAPLAFNQENQQASYSSLNVDADLRLLIESNISLEGLSIHRPNLDDLFLKLTGHALRQ